MKVGKTKSKDHGKGSQQKQDDGKNWMGSIKKFAILIFVKFWQFIRWIYLKLADPRWLVAFATTIYAIFAILQ
ncbi:MAG: hypothetical protein ABSB79_12690 [Syntrophales bacterium]|jgi:hypothetical protein